MSSNSLLPSMESSSLGEETPQTDLRSKKLELIVYTRRDLTQKNRKKRQLTYYKTNLNLR